MHLSSVANSSHWDTFEQLYLSAFPKEELTDIDHLKHMEEQKQCHMLVITDEEDHFYGLAILFLHKRVNLLAYLAVHPDYRGQGIGSRVLELLRTTYGNFTLEAESTFETNISNLKQRKRRKNFYLRNKLHMLDYTVLYSDIEMELFSTTPADVSIGDYFTLYDELFGEDFINQNLALETIML